MDTNAHRRHGDVIELHEVSLDGGVETRIHVEVLSGDADVGLSLYDASEVYAAKSDYHSGGYANNGGPGEDEFVVVNPDSSAFYGLAVWKVDSDDLYPTLTYNVIISPDPNLIAATPAGWYGPIVPRNATDAAFGWAPLPDSLLGNQPTTSFNFSVFNEGVGDVSGTWESLLYVDDVPSWPGVAGPLGSGEFAQWINTTQGVDQSIVRGGLHHIRLDADSQDDVVETFETDNTFVEWFVWTPLDLPDRLPIVRETPPNPSPAGYGPWPSCDGFRVEPAAAWTAVGILPLGPMDDPDLLVHPMSTRSKDGFGASYAGSYEFNGESDFAIVNRNVAGWEPVDFGVFGLVDIGEFIVQRVDAPYRGAVGLAGATFGPFGIGPEDVLDFHEIEIDGSVLGTTLYISLDQLGGDADLGLAIFDLNSDYAAGWEAAVRVNDAGDGQDEHLPPVTFALGGSYGIAVFKTGHADFGKSSEYRLAFSTTNVVDSPHVAAPPDRFALGAPRPNPFGPETRIRYDVPAAGGHVSVSVFDIRGRRVATLVEGHEPAGRHTALWRGLDQSGRKVGSGIYFVQLESPTAREVKKITLLR